MFYVLRFILCWAIWYIFADKKRWKEILPVCVFGSFLDLVLSITAKYFPYWEYFNPNLHPIITSLADDFDVYPVVIYLFIQWLPKEQSYLNMFIYWFIWTEIAITIEFIHLQTGNMAHLHGWALWKSYLADWFLYWLIYQFHKTFEVKKFQGR